MDIRIRNEEAGDTDVIDTIVKEAFSHQSHHAHTQHLILAGLRREEALALSLVAVTDQTVVGNIAFTEVEISDGSPGWFGLALLVVAAGMQKKGVGSALVRDGLLKLRQRGAQGCVVLGEPAFFSRFGFKNNSDLMIEETPQENFLALAFADKGTAGVVSYHPLFYTAL